MRWSWLLLSLFILAAGSAARAEDFSLPGLQADSDAYADSLSARNPAGGTVRARVRAEQQASEAARQHDWAAAAAGWESRIALGDGSASQWLALAEAQMRRAPPNAARALQAAWQSFSALDTGPQQNPALLLMADALKVLGRAAQSIGALQAALDRSPDDPRLREALADARRNAGLLVHRVRTEPEAEPPRACVEFSVAPVRRDDFHPADWVQFDPSVPGAAITREGDQLCVSGLASGRTTTLVLRAGMPGEDGLSLREETSVPVAMGNKRPRIVFDTRFFLLPRGQTPKLSLTTVNVSAVKLTVARLTERNVLPFVRDNRLGERIESWSAEEIADRMGSVVWHGRAGVPQFQPNRPAQTALPLPDAMLTAGPGLYAMLAEAGDGTPDAPSAVQMILRTDLAPTVWRGSDGLTVQVRGFSDVKPREGVRLELLAENNEILSKATTDADGVARFAAPLLHGTGPMAPRAVHVFGPEDDFTALDLDRASFDLSDRGVTGQPHPGPLDAYVWLHRGIYRPGETVQVMALLRDSAGAPVDFPARVTVKRPNGQVFVETTPPRGGDASLHLPVNLSSGAPVGTWSVEVRADPAAPPIGRTEFRVDAFVPDRMAVELGPAPGPLVTGQPYSLPVAARFLYGAPGAGPSGKGTLRLVVDPVPFPALAGFRIGLEDEVFAPDSKEIALPDTDADGHTALPIALPRTPDTTHALRAEIDVGIDDPSGHAAHARTDIAVRPVGTLIGIKPLFAAGAVDAGSEAAFQIATVSPDGKPTPLTARLRLVRERPDWRLVTQGSLARYETLWRDEPLETQQVTIPADGTLRFARSLDFGRYRLEVTEFQGLAGTSVRFRSGWVASDSPDVPDQVDVSAERAAATPGATTRIHIAPPFGGEATVLVLTDRVHLLRTLSVPEGGSDVEIPVGPDWGPGAYVAVHLYRPAADPRSSRPGRAIGLTWIGIDPAARKLDVSLETPEKYPPRGAASVSVRTAPGAWVSLAAVDEGILRLTGFSSPDPVTHFLGRRRLGLDIRDDWGRLIAPAEGEATPLRQGGDEGGFALPDIPQKTVTLFSPPVQAGADGVARLALDLPDFAGQVRLMAVAWSGARIGAASADVLVRDELIAEPLLPRFLAPGDEARFSVLMQNLDLPSGETVAEVSVQGELALAGPARLAATLAQGAQAFRRRC